MPSGRRPAVTGDVPTTNATSPAGRGRRRSACARTLLEAPEAWTPRPSAACPPGRRTPRRASSRSTTRASPSVPEGAPRERERGPVGPRSRPTCRDALQRAGDDARLLEVVDLRVDLQAVD